MSNYIDVESMRRAATTADSAADSMRHSVRYAEESAGVISRAAQQMEDAATRIAHLLEPGYGGNGLRLVEALEAAQQHPQPEPPPFASSKVVDDQTMQEVILTLQYYAAGRHIQTDKLGVATLPYIESGHRAASVLRRLTHTPLADERGG